MIRIRIRLRLMSILRSESGSRSATYSLLRSGSESDCWFLFEKLAESIFANNSLDNCLHKIINFQLSSKLWLLKKQKRWIFSQNINSKFILTNTKTALSNQGMDFFDSSTVKDNPLVEGGPSDR